MYLRLRYLRNIGSLFAILMLVAQVFLFVQQIPPTSSNISKEPIEGWRVQDSFIHSYSNHDPINITSNADFASLGFPGSGILADPYVIEGYNITVVRDRADFQDLDAYWAAVRDCINIQDTDVHYIIRDCLLDADRIGINLDSVMYGVLESNIITGNSEGVNIVRSSDIKLESNIISGNFYGVRIAYSSNNNELENNIISGNDYGVTIYSSSFYNRLENNTISGNCFGVSIGSSSDNLVANNSFSGNNFGLQLIHSSGNTLSSNIFVNNGICIHGTELEHWHHDIATDNLVNGKPLGYFWNLLGGVIDGTQYGQVILGNCVGVTVEDGVFSNVTSGIALGYSSQCNLINNTNSGNYYGIDLRHSSFNTVVNNTNFENKYGVNYWCSSNNTLVNNIVLGNEYGVLLSSSRDDSLVDNIISGNDYGVSLECSSENMLERNIISGNKYGVNLWVSSRNIVERNIISGNDHGLYTMKFSEYNTINLNNFTENNNWNGYDDGTGNDWMRNYWSDYSGSGVYFIAGDAGAIDVLPLISPSEITESDVTALAIVSMSVVGIELIIGILIVLRYRKVRTD